MNPPRAARVRVPGSTSNLGAGFDCIGLALDRYLTAEYEPGPDPLRLERAGTLADLDDPPARDRLLAAFRRRMARAGGTEPTGVVRAHSEIPIARGLGSSAAAVVAGLALAAAAAEDAPLDRRAALADAADAEGHPDNAAPALLGGLVAVARVDDDAVRAVRLPLDNDLGLAYAAPGVRISTRTARDALPDTVPHTTATRALGRVAALVEGLGTADPELIRIGFDDELHTPYRLPLVPAAEHVMAAAREAGAWAVTISGAGSGLIAACPPDRARRVADAMGAAFRRHAGDEDVVAFPATPDHPGVRTERSART